jgi:hypothetical protein
VAVWIVPTVLRSEGDGRIAEEVFKAQTPGILGHRHAFRRDVPGSIDRMDGQHVHTGEKERPVGDREEQLVERSVDASRRIVFRWAPDRHGQQGSLTLEATIAIAISITGTVESVCQAVCKHTKTLGPAHEELLNLAAQAAVLYNDDTTMKVLQLTRKQRAAALADDADGERTGVFTSGIVATHTGHQIALFFTGVRHAGENLAAVLARRNTDLPAPIQMCDGLSRNIPSEFDTILSQCLAHARRRYVELTETFPAKCASSSRRCARCISPMLVPVNAVSIPRNG